MAVRATREQPFARDRQLRALVIAAPDQTEVASRPEPVFGPDELLLRVRTVGFCGSDLNTFRGLNPLVSYPRVPGHEIAATVSAVGAEVPADRFREGMLVTVVPYTACGRCAACRRGRTNACRDNETLGVQRDGALTEWIAVPWRKVLGAEGLAPGELALVEPLSVGFHAAARGRVAPEDRVLVIGCGAVGLGAVASAARRGATVIAADVDDRKLALARQAGAAHTVNSSVQPLHDLLSALTRGDGPDVVIEAVGLPATFLTAVDEVAFTGRVVYVGYAKAPVTYDTSRFVQKELDILGSRNATIDDFRSVIAMLRDGAFPVAAAVTRTVPLDGAADALREWSADPAPITRIHVNLP